MKLTTKGEYALQAMLDLLKNSNGTPVKLQEISERQHISLHYLEQLFRKLRQGNVVNSVRGPGGGYVLSREGTQITVADVLGSVGEQLSYATLLKAQSSTTEHQGVTNFLKTVEQSTKNHLNTPITNLVS